MLDTLPALPPFEKGRTKAQTTDLARIATEALIDRVIELEEVIDGGFEVANYVRDPDAQALVRSVLNADHVGETLDDLALLRSASQDLVVAYDKVL